MCEIDGIRVEAAVANDLTAGQVRWHANEKILDGILVSADKKLGSNSIRFGTTRARARWGGLHHGVFRINWRSKLMLSIQLLF